MRNYFERIMQKDPHERRRHAMQMAGLVTAAVFVVWITTLGLRLGSTQVAQDDTSSDLTASAASSINGGPNQLVSVPSNQ